MHLTINIHYELAVSSPLHSRCVCQTIPAALLLPKIKAVCILSSPHKSSWCPALIHLPGKLCTSHQRKMRVNFTKNALPYDVWGSTPWGDPLTRFSPLLASLISPTLPTDDLSDCWRPAEVPLRAASNSITTGTAARRSFSFPAACSLASPSHLCSVHGQTGCSRGQTDSCEHCEPRVLSRFLC